ncbi:sulfurtransferase TusE [Mergibacter septicus]|uniref:Sulfurtransferase n=1 Tax=Mergibacter septicus TaxID=221402 RepID=A0A8E3MCN7_9PAST|nr:TusE/DsrC/DsvC family sulfur relay protein [Mergibacter septicus]AWX15389.1 sulfurtransferase TusE [Mergibacter septicus]QDJ12867.1 sulfurtransferase TusE [Mergibacter septicus]QDJ14643.1 sulfurtransferase TusE [Mergibacter septicus]UTU47925.1 TusE/DsrC/DsvC family sulfur relay protein [Mergibacter septicus]WMR96469.1 TusE/DsrC/DsvC family sulfur relay protein [Mergibacter septicus]
MEYYLYLRSPSGEKMIATDTEGYLLNINDWSKEVAIAIAEKENLELTDAHWEVITFIQNFYAEYKTSPAIRMLVKAMAQKFGEEKGNSRYLQRLFPDGPAKQATKLAGLPKPIKCL